MRGPAGTCLPCTAHCSRCHDTGPHGCDSCYYPYAVNHGSCALSLSSIIIGSLVACCGCCCCCAACRSQNGSASAARQRARQPLLRQSLTELPGREESIQVVPRDANVTQTPSMHVPSGRWHGYYTYAGRNHNLCDFQLEFSASGQVAGAGIDDVGAYSIRGHVSGRNAEQLTFSKTYRLGSANDAGIVSEDNEGHSVHYSGRLVAGNLAAGFRGSWRLDNDGTRNNGAFHLWPAMENWASPSGSDQNESPNETFEVAEGSECVVCFDSAISTCLRPCGHIALCSGCVEKLHVPRKCPICRTMIVSVINR